LAVTRSDYTGKIALTLVGAPPGVTITPNEIGEGVTRPSASSPRRRTRRSHPHVANHGAAAGQPAVVVTTRPLIDRHSTTSISFLMDCAKTSVVAAVAPDRFAVQVTPASFFTVELPEAKVTLGVTACGIFDRPGRQARLHARNSATRQGRPGRGEGGRQTRVFADFAKGKGSIHSKILTNLAKHRVTHGGRRPCGPRIALTRTFDLDIRAAYSVKPSPRY